MRSRIPSILVAATVLALFFESAAAFARGGGRGGGGGGSRGGGGSFSRPSGGSSHSRPSGGSSYSRPSGGSSVARPSGGSSFDGKGGFTRPSQLPSNSGRVPSAPATRPSGGAGSSLGGSVTQLPSLGGGSPGGRPSQGARPGTLPAQRPSGGNFLGAAAGGAAAGAIGGAIANRPSTLPANRPVAGQRPAQRPEQRPNWGERSQGRNDQWQQRVSSRSDAWTQRDGSRQEARNNFQQNRDQRWDSLNSAREDRQNWRNQNREDWQQRRQDLWNYRGDRANEIWDNARDYYDDVFDDRWWGGCGWGIGWGGYYPLNPWWWWAPATWETVDTYVEEIPAEPIYTDYGMNVIYEGETVYVDNQPVPADQYTQPMIDLAVNADAQPPPMPPAEGRPAEWMPLGVFALAQEEKGDPILFFQISVNSAGQITGAYKSTLAEDQRPIAGQVDKASQRIAWRIGENKQTIFISTLANLTLDVSPVAIHFGSGATQTWLLIRMPAPAPAGQPEKLPDAPKTPPPLTTAKAK